ncbi:MULTISPECIES: hypothetical protein [unclassified Streptomyces]|uniref:hypothetical protein n=1 Tax=unclassified Streptomyces TaxID=2593676 RepID=UPI0022B6D9A3|nr:MULTISPECIES: hypothetical protein [unclassified Streptomyces]MCZ7414778.1 hypothetical protein [Streptomyces sp. WMMC897]MCZ7431702.1 hypothetical protein [Streptomyces sp. WMMC1477]
MTASQDPARRPDGTEPGAPSDPAAALDFGDPLSRPGTDDTDHGWGGSPSATTADAAADLARFLDEKPPHHI